MSIAPNGHRASLTHGHQITIAPDVVTVVTHESTDEHGVRTNRATSHPTVAVTVNDPGRVACAHLTPSEAREAAEALLHFADAADDKKADEETQGS